MCSERENILLDKAKAFSKRIIKMEIYLRQRHLCHHSTIDQVYRSGTSIAANLAECSSAESRSDFIHKMKVALKEANETMMWLECIQSCPQVDQRAIKSMIEELAEIRYIMWASIATARKNMEERRCRER